MPAPPRRERGCRRRRPPPGRPPWAGRPGRTPTPWPRPRRGRGASSATAVAAPRTARRSNSSDAAERGSLLVVATHSTRDPARLSPRYSTTARVSGSAQWRSSSTTSNAGSASRSSRRSIASPRTAADSSPCPSTRPTPRGRRAARAGSHGRSSGSSGSRRCRGNWANASVSGRYGVGRPAANGAARHCPQHLAGAPRPRSRVPCGTFRYRAHRRGGPGHRRRPPPWPEPLGGSRPRPPARSPRGTARRPPIQSVRSIG